MGRMLFSICPPVILALYSVLLELTEFDVPLLDA